MAWINHVVEGGRREIEPRRLEGGELRAMVDVVLKEEGRSTIFGPWNGTWRAEGRRREGKTNFRSTGVHASSFPRPTFPLFMKDRSTFDAVVVVWARFAVERRAALRKLILPAISSCLHWFGLSENPEELFLSLAAYFRDFASENSAPSQCCILPTCPFFGSGSQEDYRIQLRSSCAYITESITNENFFCDCLYVFA